MPSIISVHSRTDTKAKPTSDFLHGFGDVGEYRSVEMCSSRLLWVDTTDNIGTVLDGLLRMETVDPKPIHSVNPFPRPPEVLPKFVTYVPCFPVNPIPEVSRPYV